LDELFVWKKRPADESVELDWTKWLNACAHAYAAVGQRHDGYNAFKYNEQEAVSLMLWAAGNVGYLALSEGYVDVVGERYGRYDLWLDASRAQYYFEFKLAFRNRVLGKWNIRGSMNSAERQIGGWQIEGSARKFAAVIQLATNGEVAMIDLRDAVLNDSTCVGTLQNRTLGDVDIYFKELIGG
jgi:hypothetical protein